jgi:hypothetical protein
MFDGRNPEHTVQLRGYLYFTVFMLILQFKHRFADLLMYVRLAGSKTYGATVRTFIFIVFTLIS